MTTLIFVLQSQSRGSRKAATVLFVIALLVLGVGIPLAVISSVEARDDIPEANVSNLTAAEQHGRELFGRRCTQCHTLAASKAVAQVGRAEASVGGAGGRRGGRSPVRRSRSTPVRAVRGEVR